MTPGPSRATHDRWPLLQYTMPSRNAALIDDAANVVAQEHPAVAGHIEKDGAAGVRIPGVEVPDGPAWRPAPEATVGGGAVTGCVFGFCESPIAAPSASAPMMPAAIAALLLLSLNLIELRPKSKSPRQPRSTQMPVRSKPHERLRWHGAFDNCRRSDTLFSVSTRQKLRLLFRLSQRIVPRAAHADGAAGTINASVDQCHRRTRRVSCMRVSPLTSSDALSYRQRAKSRRIGRGGRAHDIPARAPGA